MSRVIAAFIGIALAAAPAAAQSAGREPGPGEPAAGGRTLLDADNRVTTAGTLRFWRVYSSQGARVMLKVWRPEGTRLVLVGTSPLVTAPEGAVATFGCEIPVSRNDLVGVYCPDELCIDRFADGAALSAGGDVGTASRTSFVQETGGPALAAGTTRSFDIPSPASTNLVLPVAARVDGVNGSRWITTLEVFNTGAETAQVALYFNRAGADNTQPAASAQLVVPARSTLVVDDLLAEAFELDSDAGSVDLVATIPILAHARVFNEGGESGSFGQLIPAEPAAWALGDDETPGANPNADIAYLFEVVESAEFRTNIGVANVSAVPLTVRVRAFVGTVAAGDEIALELPPFSQWQLNRVLEVLAVPAGARGVRLNVAAAPGEDGRFFAYASRVDNLSGDAVYLPGVRESALVPATRR